MNFADDKQIACSIRTPSDSHKLQQAINHFMAWCESNKMFANNSKCKIITFTRKRNQITYNYSMGTDQVQRVNDIRILGVKFDAKMNFILHTEYIINRAKASLAFVKRQSRFLDHDATMILYTALVRSLLEFASPIWSPHHNIHKKEIESIQKQFLIFFNGDNINRDENNYVLSPYTERCATADIQTLCRRRVNASIMFIHGLISGKTDDPFLRNQITLYTGKRTIRNPEFIRPRMSTTDSPFNNACRMFNHAAMFIDPTSSSLDFKQRLESLPDCAFGPWADLKR